MIDLSYGQNLVDLNNATSEVKRLKDSLSVITTERDRLLVVNKDLNNKVERLSLDRGRLTSDISALEQSLKQSKAQISLEQTAAARKVEETIEASQSTQQALASIQAELEKERLANAALRGEISALQKNRQAPATITQLPPKAIDFSALEFDIGSVIRGPDGIQGCKIKVARTN